MEYETVMVIGKSIKDILNEWAQDGWEFTAYIPPDGHNVGIIILERERFEDAEELADAA